MVAKPRKLAPGDAIRIVSPASPLLPEKTDFVRDLLVKEGYQVEFAESCFAQDHYLAGTDQERAKDLMNAFADPKVKAVLCARGGYGCARLFPYLDLDAIAASGKMFLGFSDITTLHIALNNRGLPTVHAPMPLTMAYPRDSWVHSSFLASLKGEPTVVPEAPKGTAMVSGIAEGMLVGGCLCLICDSIGTPNSIDVEGRILLIEDVDENPHRIDAMLTHLLNSGIVQKAAGILIGEMTRSDERQDEGIGGKPWREIVRDRFGNLGIPLMVDFPFGHNKNMLSLPLGVRVEMDADQGTLTYKERWCE